MLKLSVLVAIAALLIASHAAAQMPKGEYLDGKNSKVAVILAHGQGLDPDGNVVGPLRRAINSELGFHTLSLNMPNLPGSRSTELFEEYATTFPDAYARIQAAIDFFRNEKGVDRIYLMGYSMGGRMTAAFLANNPDAPVVGFIGVGLLAYPLRDTDFVSRAIIFAPKFVTVDFLKLARSPDAARKTAPAVSSNLGRSLQPL